MSGGSKTPTQSNTSTTTPWEPMQDYLKGAAGKANDWLNNPASSATYQGTTVIPFSQNTLAGMDQARGVAQNATGSMQSPLQAYSGMYNILNPIAQGDFSKDTTFGNTLGAAQQAASTSVNDAMSMAGRYGSGVHQSTMGKTIGDLTNQAMLDRQNWALGGMQSIGDRMSGAYQNALAPSETMMGLGGMQEDLAGRYAQEQLDKFNTAKQAPMDAIAQANAIFTGSGSLGGSGTQKVYQPTQWGKVGASALGGAIGGK